MKKKVNEGHIGSIEIPYPGVMRAILEEYEMAMLANQEAGVGYAVSTIELELILDAHLQSKYETTKEVIEEWMASEDRELEAGLNQEYMDVITFFGAIMCWLNQRITEKAEE